MNRLRELRKKKGLTMKQVASEIGLPYTTYVNYEKGDRDLGTEISIKLADFFNVSIDYLLGRVFEQTTHLANGVHIIRSSNSKKIESACVELEESNCRIFYKSDELVIAVDYDSSETLEQINKIVSIYTNDAREDGQCFRGENQFSTGSREDIIMKAAAETIRSSNNFRKQVSFLLAQLDENDWAELEKIYRKLGEQK